MKDTERRAAAKVFAECSNCAKRLSLSTNTMPTNMRIPDTLLPLQKRHCFRLLSMAKKQAELHYKRRRTMGKLTITGKAKREVAYDTAILSVRFNTHSDTSAEALKTITKQSEEFLNILNDSGISAESIQLGDSHVDQDYDDGKLDAYASKEFKINMLIDMPFMNSILELISDKGYAVDVDFEYHVTNDNE